MQTQPLSSPSEKSPTGHPLQSGKAVTKGKGAFANALAQQLGTPEASPIGLPDDIKALLSHRPALFGQGASAKRAALFGLQARPQSFSSASPASATSEPPPQSSGSTLTDLVDRATIPIGSSAQIN